MARLAESKIIGETTYTVTQFGALKGRKVLFRLTKLLGPVSAGIAKGGFSEEGLAQALNAWTEHAKEEDFEFLCDTFAECTTLGEALSTGPSIETSLSKRFDNHFAGKYGDMLLWLAFAIKVNFADFLGQIKKELAVSLANLGIKIKSESTSPPA